MPLAEWVKLPTGWIEDEGLRHFHWSAAYGGSDDIAALMSLLAIAHHANQDNGEAKLTYDELTQLTTLSRAKVSSGLKKLEEEKIIERGSARSIYKLSNYNSQRDWAKLPAKGLYNAQRISAFSEFRLRKVGELNALKLYFLFVSRRDRATNLASIRYDRIRDYTGIERNSIKGGLSILVLNGLVHVESILNPDGSIHHAYRLPQIEPYNHMGTRGRSRTPNFGNSAPSGFVSLD